MILRPQPIRNLLCVVVATALAAGCAGVGPTPRPTPAPTPSATASPSATPAATPSPGASASGGASPSESPSAGAGLPHVNAALENMLPAVIGNVQLTKWSYPLSSYLASSKKGDKALLVPWVVHFGRTADATDMAIAADLTQTEHFFVQAIQIPGASPGALTAEFTVVATRAGWPVGTIKIVSRTVLQTLDPSVPAADRVGTTYVLAAGDVMFIIVTDDSSLLLEALIKLPS